MKFEVLGKVTARQGDREADLRTQPQLMLAALIIAGGRPVPGDMLEHALGWDEMEEPPARGLKGVASDLRTKLSSVSPGLSVRMPRPVGSGGYEFPLEPKQADVLRFRTGVADARRASGDDGARLMRKALAEWGPSAGGLYGGQPLLGLPRSWAGSTRHGLRREHRDAVLDCLRHDLDVGRHQDVMRECDQLVADAEALGDDEFVVVWMLATYRSGHPSWAEDIFRRAAAYAENCLALQPSQRLHQLAEMIQDDDPRLGAPDCLPAVLPAAKSQAPNATPFAPAPAHRMSSPASDERKAVSEPSITFNIGGNASVGSAIARNDGHVTVHLGAAAVTDPVADDDGDPDTADRDEAR
jgi:DNA-binding SARP family transcriptional activator